MPSAEAVQEQPIKVALLLPLSGRLANLGKAMLDAAQMATVDLGDRRFQLVPIDDKGSPKGAADAATQAIAGSCQLILGPLLAPSVKAVSPIALAAGVPMIAFSSDRKVAAPGVHVMGFNPEAEVARVVEYATSSGFTRFAAVGPKNAYGSTVIDALRRTASSNGVSVVRAELYDEKTQDFAPVVRRLMGVPEPPAAPAPAESVTPSQTQWPPLPLPPQLPMPNFDALLLAEGGPQLRQLAQALSAAGVRPPTVQLLGTGKWDEPDIGSESALLNAWFAAPVPLYREDFNVRFKRAFGQAPPRLATLAYDATALAAVLARGSERTPFAEASLTDPNGFFGRDGLFRLTTDGIAERRLAILRVDRTGGVVISEPPRSFAAGS